MRRPSEELDDRSFVSVRSRQPPGTPPGAASSPVARPPPPGPAPAARCRGVHRAGGRWSPPSSPRSSTRATYFRVSWTRPRPSAPTRPTSTRTSTPGSPPVHSARREIPRVAGLRCAAREEVFCRRPLRRHERRPGISATALFPDAARGLPARPLRALAAAGPLRDVPPSSPMFADHRRRGTPLRRPRVGGPDPWPYRPPRPRPRSCLREPIPGRDRAARSRPRCPSAGTRSGLRTGRRGTAWGRTRASRPRGGPPRGARSRARCEGRASGVRSRAASSGSGARSR